MTFTVYKSSAGSGKTFTLVKEYLSLVLADPWKFKRILAITFTNKAANEMKERIIQSLFEIGSHAEKPISETIAVMFNQLQEVIDLPEEKLIKNAQKVTQLILHHYSDFAISTIDAFVHKIIRSFAFDLRLPMNFEVELDTKETLKRIIDLLISRAGTKKDLTKLLVKFTQSKTEDEQNWNIEDDIYNVAKLLMDEDSQVQVEDLKEYSINDFLNIHSSISVFIAEYEISLQKLGMKAMDIIRQAGAQVDAFARAKMGIYVWFERFSLRDFSKPVPNSYVEATVEQDKWYSTKASAADIKSIDSIKPQLSEIYLEIIQFLNEKLEQYRLSQEIRKNLYPLAILHEIERMLDEYRTENNILLISEFNQRISAVVANEPVPFIYERVGEKFQHYLVDEFQDTSVLQWQNLLPLFENSLGSGNFNMIVGDAKQAIYRWRNGEVEQFIHLPKLYKSKHKPLIQEREQVLERNFALKNLNYNFRSAAQLVKFNNEFFKTISELLPGQYQDVYKNVTQIAGSQNPGGYVGIEFYDKERSSTDREPYFLERTMAIIQEVRSLNYNPRDIAILCRNNNHASSIAAFLLENNISVVSSESLLVSASVNVRAVISIARLLIDPDDEIAKVEILHWMQQSKHAKKHWAENIEKLIRATDPADPKKPFLTNLQQFEIPISPQKLLELSVYEFCEALIRDLGIHRFNDPYVLFFLDAVLDEMKDPSFDLKSLIEWWDLKKETLSIVVPREVNAVSVMTIHKSKGLEFPIVIFPHANERLRPTKDKLWIKPEMLLPELNTVLVDASKQLEETRFEKDYEEEQNKSKLDLINILYVVMTRAADRLYILSDKPPEKKGSFSVPLILKYYLESQNLWNSDNLTYTFGDQNTQNQKPSRAYSDTENEFKITHSADWRKLVSLSLQAPDHWDIEHPGDEQERGNLVHKILARINHKEDIGQIVKEYQLQGIIDDMLSEDIQKQLINFIEKPGVSTYFKPGIQSLEEADVLLPNGDVQRPDRIIFDKDNVIIVDYKTGKKLPQHIKQIESYSGIFVQMGYKNVDGVILYINDPEPVVIV